MTDELERARQYLEETKRERDEYKLHVLKLMRERDEALNAQKIAEDTLDKLALRIVGLLSAIYQWAKAYPCKCAACRDLSRHARNAD